MEQFSKPDGSGPVDVSAATPLPVSATQIASTTGTESNVSSSASAVTLLAANTSRLGGSFFNDSTAVLYLLCSSQTPSATLYTVQVGAGAYYELPYRYTGIVKGIWASANGSARVTEFA